MISHARFDLCAGNYADGNAGNHADGNAGSHTDGNTGGCADGNSGNYADSNTGDDPGRIDGRNLWGGERGLLR